MAAFIKTEHFGNIVDIIKASQENCGIGLNADRRKNWVEIVSIALKGGDDGRRQWPHRFINTMNSVRLHSEAAATSFDKLFLKSLFFDVSICMEDYVEVKAWNSRLSNSLLLFEKLSSDKTLKIASSSWNFVESAEMFFENIRYESRIKEDNIENIPPPPIPPEEPQNREAPLQGRLDAVMRARAARNFEF